MSAGKIADDLATLVNDRTIELTEFHQLGLGVKACACAGKFCCPSALSGGVGPARSITHPGWQQEPALVSSRMENVASEPRRRRRCF